MSDKTEEKAKSPRGRRSSQPPQKTSTISTTDDGVDKPRTKRRRSAVFDTSKLSSALNEESKKDESTPTKKKPKSSGANSSRGMRRSVSGGSLKTKSTVKHNGDHSDNESSNATSSASTKDSRVQQLRTHSKQTSTASDSSMTNEEIQIMGITVSAKVKKSKSMRLDTGKIESARDKEDAKDSEAKKSARRKAANDADIDASKTHKKDADNDKKIDAEDSKKQRKEKDDKSTHKPKKDETDHDGKDKLSKSARAKSKKTLDSAESPRESSDDAPKKKSKEHDKEKKAKKESPRNHTKKNITSSSKSDKPATNSTGEAAPVVEDRKEASFSVSSSVENSPRDMRVEDSSQPVQVELPPKPEYPQAPATAPQENASSAPAPESETSATSGNGPMSAIAAAAAAAEAQLEAANEAAQLSSRSATSVDSSDASASSKHDTEKSKDTDTTAAAPSSDSVSHTGSVQNIIKKFQATTTETPAATRPMRSSSNARSSLKPGSSTAGSSASGERKERRGSTSSTGHRSSHHSPNSPKLSPSRSGSQEASTAEPEKKDNTLVTVSVLRRHSSKDIRLGSIDSRSRSGSAGLSRENSRGVSSPDGNMHESNDSITITRRSSGSIPRSSSRDALEGTQNPELSKLKEDLRRYREGYDYYKYKFREAEQWLAKDGVETFKKEFDERRRRLRDVEDAHKRSLTEIEELKARIAELETSHKTEVLDLKARISFLEAQLKEAGSRSFSTHNSSRDLTLSSSSNSLSESATGARRSGSFRGPPVSTSSAALLANIPAGPLTPTSGATTPTSASVAPLTPATKSKNSMAMLSASLVDLSQYKRTKKPAWVAGKQELEHRTRVALEMLDTEQTYVLGLNVLLENYLKPLVNYAKTEKKVAEAEITKIFADGAVEGIHVLNSKLVEQLEDRLANWQEKPELGDIFDKFAPLLKPYSRYGSRYEECLFHVTDLLQKNPKFKKVFDVFDDHAFKFSGLRLKDYMIMPVQRVPRYNMLLRDLLKHTPEDHPDFLHLQSACKKVEDVASAVNEGIRQAESQTKMAAIIERGGGFESLMKNYRSFIRSGMVPLLLDLSDRKKGAKKEGEILVFNDIIVAGTFMSKKAEPQEYSQVLPLIWVSKDLDEEQANIIQSEGFDPATGWTIKGPETTWLVVSKDQMDRSNWMNTFAELLNVPVDDLGSGERKGKYEFLRPNRAVYDGEWLDGGFYGKGTYVRHDGVLFDGHWDCRFGAGFGLITAGTQSLAGWKTSRPLGDVEPYVDEFGIFASSALTERDWSLLMTGAKDKQYTKDSKIISQAQVNTNLYRIKSGTCRVEKTNDAGQRIQLATMGPKTMFGDTAVVPSMKVATADVVADSDVVEVSQIEVPIAYEILKSNPGFSMRFYKQMALKLSQRLRNLHAPPAAKPDESKKSKKVKAAEAGQAGESKPDAADAGASDKKENAADTAFWARFDLPHTEIVIKEYDCAIKGVVRKYGHMYITGGYICFEATVFGMSSQEVIKMDRITATEVRNKKELRVAIKNKKWLFSFENNVEEVHSLIESLRPLDVKARRTTDELGEEASSASMKRKSTMKDVNGTVEGITLSKEDWALVQRGFKLVTFNKDEDIIKEGTEMQRIYQIAKGTCRIQITHPLEGPKVVGSMEAGALFGEMSFLEGKGATASVIADSDTVEMYILEGHFINLVFVANPDLSGRFYAYLASVIAERLNARERAIAKAAKKSKKAKEREREKDK